MICAADNTHERRSDRAAAVEDAVRVAVDFCLPLVREAVAALVERDQRFTLAVPRDASTSGKAVALVDTVRHDDGHRGLLSSSAIAGYVLLTRQPASTDLSRDPYGNLARMQLPREAPWQQVAEALLRVWWEVCPTVERRPRPRRTDWAAQHAALESLTPREEDVLRLIAAGSTVPEMARTLHLADSTVDNHRVRLMKKLGVHKAVDAARFAYRSGLVAP